MAGLEGIIAVCSNFLLEFAVGSCQDGFPGPREHWSEVAVVCVRGISSLLPMCCLPFPARVLQGFQGPGDRVPIGPPSSHPGVQHGCCFVSWAKPRAVMLSAPLIPVLGSL